MDAKLIPEHASRISSGKSVYEPATEPDGAHRRWLRELKRMITGAVFVELSAAYDTVDHRRILNKVLKMTGDVHLTDLIRTMLENRRFFVVREEELLATTTKRTTTGKCTGTDNSSIVPDILVKVS